MGEQPGFNESAQFGGYGQYGDQYGEAQHTQNPGEQYGADPYGAAPYGADPYGGQQYGGDPSGQGPGYDASYGQQYGEYEGSAQPRGSTGGAQPYSPAAVPAPPDSVPASPWGDLPPPSALEAPRASFQPGSSAPRGTIGGPPPVTWE